MFLIFFGKRMHIVCLDVSILYFLLFLYNSHFAPHFMTSVLIGFEIIYSVQLVLLLAHVCEVILWGLGSHQLPFSTQSGLGRLDPFSTPSLNIFSRSVLWKSCVCDHSAVSLYIYNSHVMFRSKT